MTDSLISEQIRYYQERASEYDEWFLRQGRYDRGEETNRKWFAEIGEVRAALVRFKPKGRVLEIAAGTGIWTQELLRHADHVTALDSSEDALALCRERVGEAGGRLQTKVCDVFEWTPQDKYDVVFFSFWLSHVPEERFESFWNLVSSALAPGGRVFLVDSLYTPESTAQDHLLETNGVVERKLNDGRSFRVVKVFHTPETLSEKLAKLGWVADLLATKTFFLYGPASREE